MSPCVFYKFNHRRIPDDPESFHQSFNDCFSLLNEFGANELLQFGLNDYKIASLNLKNINHDEQKILKLIRKPKKRRMAFSDLYQKFAWKNEDNENVKVELFKPPINIASQFTERQRIHLKYFDRDIVNHLIACHLEDKIYSDSVQTTLLKTKIKIFRNDSLKKEKAASVSKTSKGTLKGLADIEIIQYCSISSQFNYGFNHTLFALTFDKKLADLLQEKTKISIEFEPFGEDSLNTIKNNFERLNSLEHKRREMFGKLFLFCEDLSSYLS